MSYSEFPNGSIFLLQCGRIYKDAEIGIECEVSGYGGMVLQCGRIYKDAEIKSKAAFSCQTITASMWPHL